jgi:hypothetical protein
MESPPTRDAGHLSVRVVVSAFNEAMKALARDAGRVGRMQALRSAVRRCSTGASAPPLLEGVELSFDGSFDVARILKNAQRLPEDERVAVVGRVLCECFAFVAATLQDDLPMQARESAAAQLGQLAELASAMLPVLEPKPEPPPVVSGPQLHRPPNASSVARVKPRPAHGPAAPRIARPVVAKPIVEPVVEPPAPVVIAPPPEEPPPPVLTIAPIPVEPPVEVPQPVFADMPAMAPAPSPPPLLSTTLPRRPRTPIWLFVLNFVLAVALAAAIFGVSRRRSPSAPAASAVASTAPRPSTTTQTSATQTAATQAVAPSVVPSQEPAPVAASSTGTIVTAPGQDGHRVFVDGKLMGDSPQRIEVTCGRHEVRFGSKSPAWKIDVPCGAEIVLKLR